MNISVGGILSFTLIFIITMFIAKIVANIFQDEWLIKVLPRGIAPAISLIIRILLIATGFYMGLSAAGFDLSKISLLLGALGVGIGFGLQSIVLNFISGLILAFERPINLGDAIEVDQEFGVVTSIGVRASNIKTYKGSEVIIPNGDLVSKKVVNWTLSNRDRRSKILMKTSADADPEKVIALFNRIAGEHPNVYKDPEPVTHFYGFNQEGNLDFALIYWTSFSDTLKTDSDIALRIFKTLKEEGIQAPIPRWKIESDAKKGGFST
jgi:potassium-dependent mechanosensitive channel